MGTHYKWRMTRICHWPHPFLVYINHLPDGPQSKTKLCVDDTVVYMTVANDSDAEALQDDLNKLAELEDRWQMEFHMKKCNIIRITRSLTINSDLS